MTVETGSSHGGVTEQTYFDLKKLTYYSKTKEPDYIVGLFTTFRKIAYEQPVFCDPSYTLPENYKLS
jgi:hypothetical protein